MKRLLRVLATIAILGVSSRGSCANAESITELRWFKGNTHTHTINSDGDSTPDFVVKWYREHGYQFLFITDHEYITDVGPLNALFGATDRFLILPGQEVTQWSDDPSRAASRFSITIGAGAHINVLFAKQVVLPIGLRPCMEGGCGANAPANMPIKETFDKNFAGIAAQGAIPQINHPNLLWSLKPEDLADAPDGSLLEIWNGGGDYINNLGGDDGHGDSRPSAEDIWGWLLDRGKVVWGVGSDDSHTYQPPRTYEAGAASPGRAWITVHASALTSTSIRDAIARGEFYASNGVTLGDVFANESQLTLVIKPESFSFPTLALPRYSTRFVGSKNETLAVVPGTRAVYKFKGSEAYVRAVITDSNGRKAWTQPVFLDGRKNRSPYVRR